MADLSRRRWLAGAAAGATALAGTRHGRARPASAPASGRVLAVGPQRALRTPAAAAAVVADGDVVEIDAGEYTDDVALWAVPTLTLRSTGGRARLRGGSASIENKGLWVNRCDDLRVQGIDFWGERGLLTASDCGFFLNQNGILTNNDPQCALVLEACEFARNGHGDGQTHNLYVGSIARLDVRACWFHDAVGGHLLKSRARVNRVFHSLLADSAGGGSSYELEFPNGGDCIVTGNLLLQAAGTQNLHLVSFGTEGWRTDGSRLAMVHNTCVDRRRQGGVFLRVRDGGGAEVTLWNNLFLGPGRLPDAASAAQGNRIITDADLEQPLAGDYRPRRGGAAWRQAQTLPATLAQAVPEHEYQHPRRLLRLARPPQHAGASQTSRLARTEP
jgi:hypothetical protein